MMVGAKCAPHYRRIVYEHDSSSPLSGRMRAAALPALTIAGLHRKAISLPVLICPMCLVMYEKRVL